MRGMSTEITFFHKTERTRCRFAFSDSLNTSSLRSAATTTTKLIRLYYLQVAIKKIFRRTIGLLMNLINKGDGLTDFEKTVLPISMHDTSLI